MKNLALTLGRSLLLACVDVGIFALYYSYRGKELGGTKLAVLCTAAALGALIVWTYQCVRKKQLNMGSELFAIAIAGAAAVWVLTGVLRIAIAARGVPFE